MPPLKKIIPLPKLPDFRRRRPRPPSQVTALDVDGQTLRIVQCVPGGSRTMVTRVAATGLDLPPEADRGDPNTMGRAIARALVQLRVRPSSVVMGVPRAQVVLRTLTLPVLDDLRELASMVHFQVSRDLPFRMDEAVVDFKVRRQINPPVPIASDGKSDAAPPPKLEVLVAAVKRDVVDQYVQTAEAAGLRLSALGLLPYANARCLDACNVTDGDQAVALVSLRPDEVNIDVIAQQTLLFSRGAAVKVQTEPAAAGPPAERTEALSTPPNGDAATSATVSAEPPPSFADLVTIEVVRSLHAYSGMEPQNPVLRTVVIGATGHEGTVVEALGRRLNIPCSTIELASVLDLPGEARDQAPGAIAPIGLALGVSDARGLPFDFLNPKRPAVQRDMRRIRILASVAAAAAVVVFVLALRTHFIRQRERVLAQVNAEHAEAKQKQPLYQRMIRQAATVDEWSQGARNWLEHYAYLSAILPPSEEVYLTSLAVSGAGVIRLSVQARSGEILAKLDKQLRAAGYDVKPLAINPGADRHGYEFRSSVELSVPEKMKIDLSKVKTPARPPDDASLDPVLNKGGGG